jgi:adhesin transport system membrane fusion protein
MNGDQQVSRSVDRVAFPSSSDWKRGAPAPSLARTPKGVRRLARFLVALLFALAPATLFAPWTQTVHGTGRAIAFDPVRRPQTIVSPIQGRVMKWHVKEGDRVKAGDRMVDLVDNDPRRLEMLREQRLLADQRRTLARSMVDEQESRLKFIEAEAPLRVAQAKARMDAAEAAVPLARQELLRANADEARTRLAYQRQRNIYQTPVAGLEKGGALSKDQLEEAERQWTLARERIPLVEAQIKVAEKQFAAAAEEHQAIRAQTQAAVQAERLALAGRRSEQAAVVQQFETVNSDVVRQENQFVAAPTTGTVFRILANAEAGGQLVNPGQHLAVLVPDVTMNAITTATRTAAPHSTLTADGTPGIVAELLIDGNDLPLVRKGDRVLLQFEGWAAVQFAAYPEAAAGTFEGRVYLVDPTSDGQGQFRILVEPAPGAAWPDESFLRQGVRAQGWIVIQQVRLGYELWRLLNGFPPARPVNAKEQRQNLSFGPIGVAK